MPERSPFMQPPRERERRAAERRRHWLNIVAGALFGLAIACAVRSLLLPPGHKALGGDGLDWLSVAFLLAIAAAFVYPERGGR